MCLVVHTPAQQGVVALVILLRKGTRCEQAHRWSLYDVFTRGPLWSKKDGGIHVMSEDSSLMSDFTWKFIFTNSTFCELSVWHSIADSVIQPKTSKAEPPWAIHTRQRREDAGVAEDGSLWQKAVRSVWLSVGHRPGLALAEPRAAGQAHRRGKRMAPSVRSVAEECWV